MRIQITKSNDRTVTWANLEVDREFITDATVTMTLTDEDGAPVSNAEDLPLEYVSGSNGRYEGVIDSTITSTLTVGGEYQLVLTAISGSHDAYVVLDVDVVERGC